MTSVKREWKSFENLARGSNPTNKEIDEVTEQVKSELHEAGIDIVLLGIAVNTTEVPSKAIGFLSKWGFTRDWRYWIAEGPGIPIEIAEKLYASHGRECRVGGSCVCPSPREAFGGFGVGLYHVDTQEGLNALADAIRSVGN